MLTFDNNDLYQILLNRLRKDRKGSISPEEFESFLRNRNLDYFGQQLGVEGVSSINHESLAPFMVTTDQCTVRDSTDEEGYAMLDVDYPGGEPGEPTYRIAKLINAWFLDTGSIDLMDRIPIDIVSSSEWAERFTNSHTKGTITDPVGYIGTHYHETQFVTYDVLWLQGIVDGDGIVSIDYYRYPADPYYDYYTDANGNITYLTDGQAEYTLQAGEVSRSGLTAGAGVTSASSDLEWNDRDAMNILDMVMSDVGIAQNDQAVHQSSVLERQQNVKA